MVAIILSKKNKIIKRHYITITKPIELNRAKKNSQ